MKPAPSDIEKLIQVLVWPFYAIERDMLIPTDGEWRKENDAEHSWSLGLVACALAHEVDPSLDLGKIAQYALVHDLVEIYAGDTTPWDGEAKLASKEGREEESAHKIKADFTAFPWISEMIEHYESKTDNESKFVWATDKYLALYMRYLDRGEFYPAAGITPAKFEEGMKEHRRKAHANPTIAKYYDALYTTFLSHPEYFAK